MKLFCQTLMLNRITVWGLYVWKSSLTDTHKYEHDLNVKNGWKPDIWIALILLVIGKYTFQQHKCATKKGSITVQTNNDREGIMCDIRTPEA